MKKLHKKAVSPAIATIIVVALCLVLGAIIMRFGGDYIKNLSAETEEYEGRISCSIDVEIEIMNACFDRENSRIDIVVANKRSKAIKNDNFYIQIYQENGIDFQPFKIDNLAAGEIKKSHARYKTEQGDPTKISIIPVIKSSDREIICGEDAEEVNVIEC